MSHESTKRAPGEGRGEERVGYGRPPVGTRFRKGVSGNPSGSSARARENARRAAAVDALVLAEAYRPVTVKEGGRVRRMPAIAAVMRSQLASALKGNGPAQRATLAMVREVEREAPGATSAPAAALAVRDERRDEAAEPDLSVLRLLTQEERDALRAMLERLGREEEERRRERKRPGEEG